MDAKAEAPEQRPIHLRSVRSPQSPESAARDGDATAGPAGFIGSSPRPCVRSTTLAPSSTLSGMDSSFR